MQFLPSLWIELFLTIALILLLLLLNLQVEAQVTATISPNQDYNVPLDENFLIQFNCTGTEAIIQWRVDGIPANYNSIVRRGISTTPAVEVGGGLYFSSLFIQTTNENHNTSVQCTAVRLTPLGLNSSKLIFLNIQGLLGAPPKLTISESNENMARILSWDSPETLDLTDIEPDILYYTVCYNLSVEFTCINVSSSEKREFRYYNICVSLLITVTAVNVVGEGSSSSILSCRPNSCGEPKIHVL